MNEVNKEFSNEMNPAINTSMKSEVNQGKNQIISSSNSDLSSRTTSDSDLSLNSDLISIITCSSVSKVFMEANQPLNILSNIEFSLAPGEQVAIMGRSGSGKSTLLQILGGLDQPTEGTVFLKGQNLHTLTEVERARLRNQTIGFVFQFHHLLPEFTALENVCLPMLIAKTAPSIAETKAAELLEMVGLSDRMQHFPATLSGGERQRVAIARALANNPECVLADEPTGNLDDENAEQVFEIIQRLNRSLNTSFIIVTHDEQLAARMDRALVLQGGKLLNNNIE